MASILVPTVFNIDLEFEAADISRRFLAYLIDTVIRIVYVYLAGLLFPGTLSDIFERGTNYLAYMLVVVVPYMFYFLIFEWLMQGQTPGKRIIGIKVTSIMGNPPSFDQLLMRWLFRMIENPFLFFFLVPVAIPIVSILRSPYKQRLGDIVANTIVIESKQKLSIQETIFRDIKQEDYKVQFPQITRLSDRDLNKVRELLERARAQKDEVLAARVAQRIKEVLNIETDMMPMEFLETLFNDYNYLVTKNN
ncbi:putative RDD family membrane protein YckC [Chitinophaga skermanii]|uniref:Putative RDD family membrane protein YckC n=1 Tax=Chitinophaga skermanii TaxID=331697 RepID=A0A327QAK7_9BACT|nr:RDD family protein [Chitinophaga skermanii]RAJ01666.1 putative RDD family membrane protein YckC [Chitinophaga skermanii]